MIVQGLSYDQILDRVRDTGEDRRRSALIERKDIRNIALKLGLGTNYRLAKDDSVSVRLKIKEMEKNNELLLFKDQGEDLDLVLKDEFVLCFSTPEQRTVLMSQLKRDDRLFICMDSTHGISQYDGYQLTTLMIVTELNKGYPVAFMLSSTVNENIVVKFLESVKKVTGVIKAKVFMSDDDPIYRGAWQRVMAQNSSDTLYLLCAWHVDRAIRKNIASKVSGTIEDKAMIYQMFRVLFEELDEDEFLNLATKFKDFLEEENLEEFKVYFEKYYLRSGRVELWAKCYRTSNLINTNNHLESMHSVEIRLPSGQKSEEA